MKNSKRCGIIEKTVSSKAGRNVKTIQFRELVELSFDIHNIIIIEHHWHSGDHFAIPSGGRPDNGIMFLANCDFE